MVLLEGAVIAHLLLRTKMKGDGKDRWILEIKENDFIRIQTPDERLETDISFFENTLIFGTATDDLVGVNYRIKNGEQVIYTHIGNNEFFKDSDGNGIPDYHAILNSEEGNLVLVPKEIIWEPGEPDCGN